MFRSFIKSSYSLKKTNSQKYFSNFAASIPYDISLDEDSYTPQTTSVQLTIEEQILLNRLTICSITFFDGKFPKQFLSERVNKILNINPWLSSRVVKKSDGSVQLEYQNENERKNYFRQIECTDLSSNLPSMKLTERVNEFLKVKNSANSLNNKSAKLFEVVGFKISNNKYALAVVLNHTLGDGHTFYQIYKMLDHSLQPFELNPTRKQIFEEKKKQILCPKGSELSFLAMKIGDLKNFFLPKRQILLYEIDLKELTYRRDLINEKIKNNNKKSKKEQKIKFVSSNDVLASIFYENTKTDYSFTAFTFRNRMNGLTDNMAGNHVGYLCCDSEDSTNPLSLRKALINLKGTESRKLPGFFGFLPATTSLTTNITGFYHDLQMPNSKTTFSTAAIDMSHGNRDHMAFIFKASPTKMMFQYASRDPAELDPKIFKKISMT